MGVDSYYSDSQIFSSVIPAILVQGRKPVAILKCKILPFIFKMLWHFYYSNPNHIILATWYVSSKLKVTSNVYFYAKQDYAKDIKWADSTCSQIPVL